MVSLLSLIASTLSSISYTLFLLFFFFFLMTPPPPRSTLFPYTTLFRSARLRARPRRAEGAGVRQAWRGTEPLLLTPEGRGRSEEHTSELQSLTNLVCRLLLEKKKKKNKDG